MLPAIAGAEDAPAGTGAPVHVDQRTSVYQDNDRTSIVTSTVAASAQVNDLTVTGRYLIDVISSASVDVTTAATGRFHENRHETEASVAYGSDTDSVSAGYIYSRENDWSSHTANLGGSMGLLSKNLVLSGGVGLVRNHVGRKDDPNFARLLDVGSASLGLTANLSPRTLAQIVLNGAVSTGYQSSPYRFVRLGGNGPGFAETTPDRRQRGSVTLRLARHFLKDTSLHLHTRGYRDDWGLGSLTGGAELLVGFGAVTAGLRARGYTQTGATFYRGVYAQPLVYMSADRELSPFSDVFAGGRLLWEHAARRIVSTVRVELKVEGFRFWFTDFPLLPSRTGIVADLAVGVGL